MDNAMTWTTDTTRHSPMHFCGEYVIYRVCGIYELTHSGNTLDKSTDLDVLKRMAARHHRATTSGPVRPSAR